MTAPLTVRQRRVLDAIRHLTAAKGYPPTVRELAAAADLHSTSSVAHVLDVLMARGYITREPGASRTIIIKAHP